MFDAAISRFGTMFFADPTAAFVNIARGLRPSGRLCVATWQPLIANEWLTIPGAALSRYGTIPETEASGPGMFAQSRHGHRYVGRSWSPQDRTIACDGPAVPR